MVNHFYRIFSSLYFTIMNVVHKKVTGAFTKKPYVYILWFQVWKGEGTIIPRISDLIGSFTTIISEESGLHFLMKNMTL